MTHTLLGPLMQKTAVGAFKTLDALDFSIEHLSLYERRLGLMTMDGKLKDRTVKVAEHPSRADARVTTAATQSLTRLFPFWGCLQPPSSLLLRCLCCSPLARPLWTTSGRGR